MRVCVCYHPICSERLACGYTSRGHTGGRSLRISSPPPYGAGLSFNATRLQPRLCTSIVKSDFMYERLICVCVFFPFILDIKFVGRTSRGHTGGRSHRISHPPSFCGACLNFSREKVSAIPFPRRPCSRILCTNDLIVLHPLDIFILFFSCLVRKIPFAGIELTSQRVRGLRGTSELPGDRTTRVEGLGVV